MDARFYNSDEIDIERLSQDLMNVYSAQGYQTQQIGSKDQMLIQIKKGGDLEALVGLQAALSLTLQRTGGGTLAMIGQQRWLDKAAVGAVGIIGFAFLWPLALTAGAGALRQASLGNQVLNVVDGLVRQQRPSVQFGPVPPQFMPQAQQQWGTPPPSYGQQVPFYTPPAQQQPPMYTPPAQQQPQTPPYTPPAQQQPQTPPMYMQPPVEQPPAPTYTPPVQPKPVVPVYTPPATPPVQPVQRAEPLYTPPVQPRPQPAPEPLYVPPVTQNPSVQPQPKVTMIPSAQQDAPVAPPQPRAQPQYYIPSNQATQQSEASDPTIANTAVQPQQGIDTTVPWGVLTFADGKQVSLTGTSALVGRYDHDLGGDKPAVDLSDQQGADTTSRVHAVFEHTGGTYTLTDLNSTNSTRINNKRLDPDKATPLNDGDTILFGRVTATFKKL